MLSSVHGLPYRRLSHKLLDGAQVHYPRQLATSHECFSMVSIPDVGLLDPDMTLT